MSEARLLAHIYARSAGVASGPIVVGPGDDCAVVRLTGETLATVDHLVEGRHFEAGPRMPSADLIARKAIARSVSDIAAMGGTPTCALAAACLRRTFELGDELFDAMHAWAIRLGCPLVGGDIATHAQGDSPIVLSVTVLGTAHPSRGPVLRSGARAGDRVYVTGRLGGSLASGRHLSFDPRTAEARYLCDTLGRGLHAMIDLSDGLGRDAGRIAVASGVRLELDAAAVPCHADVHDWRSAASDGEDYELLFCVAGDAPTLPALVPGTSTRLTPIGRVTEGSGCAIRTPDGKIISATEMGWDHT